VNPYQRPLQGCTIGLSISESADSTALGFPPWQINHVTVQMVAALFGQGASVVFGHDWRDDGVMEAVHAFALQMQPVTAPADDAAGATAQPLLQNVLPWPENPRLKQEELDRLNTTLRVEQAGLPPGLQQFAAEFADERQRNTDRYRYLRARGLTRLRRVLDEKARARVSIGGRTGGSQGRYPGIIEEAYLAVRQSKPLYLCGILGGATRQVIDAIEGKDIPPDFCSAENMRALYQKEGQLERDQATLGDRTVEPSAVWQAFKALGPAGLSRNNRLSKEDNSRLFRTVSLDEAIQLILSGLARVCTPP
jgi:hypothetical protein